MFGYFLQNWLKVKSEPMAKGKTLRISMAKCPKVKSLNLAFSSEIQQTIKEFLLEGRIWNNIYLSKNFLSLVVLVKLHVLLAIVRGEQQ